MCGVGALFLVDNAKEKWESINPGCKRRITYPLMLFGNSEHGGITGRCCDVQRAGIPHAATDSPLELGGGPQPVPVLFGGIVADRGGED